jgi:hypothetical protein
MIDSPYFSLAILTCPVLVVVVGQIFKQFQNQKELVGGVISTPKSLWLSYTVITWFLAPIIFLCLPVHPNLMFILVIHLISFWIRGLVELVMIYKWFNWSPRYGITHSGFHALMLIGLSTFAFPMEFTTANTVTIVFLATIIVTTLFETLFAALFFKVRSLDTGIDTHKIYFASDDEKWKKVNKTTELALFLGFLGYGLIIGAHLIMLGVLQIPFS